LSNQKKYIAFFDLDHTILNDSSGSLLGIPAFVNKIFKRRYFIEAVLLSLGYKLEFIDPQVISSRMTQWLKGQTEQKIVEFMNTMFGKLIKPAIRLHARREIEFHKNNNALTVILSASIEQICEPVRQYLGFDDMICSSLEVHQGLFTGLPHGRYCYGEEKLTRSLQFCADNNLVLNNAWFYTDSYSDLPMLNAVENPICVSPDRLLRRYARQVGWKISNW